MSSCNSQTVFTFGVCENAEDTVTTAPKTPDTDLVSTVPSGNMTLNVGLFVVGRSVAAESSTVIWVVVAELTLPPLRTPDLTGSAISITAPGRTTTPESIDVVKVQTSDSLFSEKTIAFANLLAWPRLVHANAFTCLITTPILEIKSASS